MKTELCDGQMSTFLCTLMNELDFPAEAAAFFTALEARVEGDAEYLRHMEECEGQFLSHGTGDIRAALSRVRETAQMYGENEYSLDMLYLLRCCRTLAERYSAAGLSMELFKDTMHDLTYKLYECREVKGVWGTFVAWWYQRFFSTELFKLGRLEFEQITYNGPDYEEEGHVLCRGERVINMHIPSCGPLTREARMDSYARAYRFFCPEGGHVFMVCSSWLLYPRHRDFLTKPSNILDFMDDFMLVSSSEEEEFANAWRVFGAQAELDAAQWSENTALRRDYKRRVLSGGKTGHGLGVFLYPSLAKPCI